MFLLHRLFRIFPSLCIFLFSALALIVPSGYTVGPLLLFFASFFLLFERGKLFVNKGDWLFICLVFSFIVINFFLSFYHNLGLSSHDKTFRYLLAIPVYLFLIAYPPKINYFSVGLILGSFGAGSIAICQQFGFFISFVWPGRSSGFLNPIQFGNISLLMAFLVLPFIIFNNHERKLRYFSLLLISSFVAGCFASFLSLTRGGWLAIPVVFLFLYKDVYAYFKRWLFVSLILICFVFFILVYCLPDFNYINDRIVAAGKLEVNNFFQGGGENTSFGARTRMWVSGFHAFNSRPFLGWGDLESIKINFSSQWVELNKLDNFNHLHNEYIDALAKKGLVGFTALMAMYLVPLYYFVGLMRTRQADVMPFAAAGVVLILCVMVFGLTQCFLAHNSGTMVFVFYLVIIKAYCRNIVAARKSAAHA